MGFVKPIGNNVIRTATKAFVCAAFAALALPFAFSGSAYADDVRIADPSTSGTWASYVDDGTEEVGRVWTDKSVSKSNFGSVAIGDSNFLVTFSALSSTSNISATSATPLDIVLVLDASGSMEETIDWYQPVYGSDIENNKVYYVFVDDKYVKLERNNNKWGYKVGIKWNYFTPKSSAESGEGDQFYSHSTITKMQALENAAEAFVDAVAAENDKTTNVSMHHYLSVVKFAGDISASVGNETYRASQNGRDYYDFNYSQPIVNFERCTPEHAAVVKRAIEDINPAGATAAHNGMAVAQMQLSGGREGAQKVVIFFTDGAPTEWRDFSSTVANGAITTAKAMKDQGTIIYSIGIFDGADPDEDIATTTEFNRYMHAISGNYPSATSYSVGTMGSPAAKGGYYKAATSAGELSAIFDDIFKEVNGASGSPTKVELGYDANKSGYVTYTDRLGDYMKVDDFRAIEFAGEVFEPAGSPSVKQNGDGSSVATYRFSGSAGNALYPDGDLEDIVITVTRSASDDLQTGDLVEIKVPATLIPLYSFSIEETVDALGNETCEMVITDSDPIRVHYGVSLKEGVRGALASGDDEALNEYVAANTVSGQACFYSNKYSGSELQQGFTIGDAKATFTPSATNPFYHHTQDALIYEDAEGTVPATSIEDGGSYWWARTHYELTSSPSDGNAADKVTTLVPVPQEFNSDLRRITEQNDEGQLCIPAGTKKVAFLHEYGDQKGANPTATAGMVVDPHWNSTAAPVYVNSFLGNNGRLSVDIPGTISVTKELALPEYAQADKSLSDKAFQFQVKLTAPAGSTLKSSYAAKIVDASGEAESTSLSIDGGTGSFKLRGGETIFIYGLEEGVSYEVREILADDGEYGFKLDDVSVEGGLNPSADPSAMKTSAVVVGGVVSSSVFENAFEFEPARLPGATAFDGAKTLVGRDWMEGDSFTFVIQAITDKATTPMPAQTELTLSYNLLDPAVDGEAVSFSFGDVEFTEPGTYVYHIYEKDPALDAKLPGVAYSTASYIVTVEVTYNAASAKLEAEASMQRTIDDEGNELGTLFDVNSAMFTNSYSAADVEFGITASKILTDNGDSSVSKGTFEFALTPVGKKANGSDELIATTDIPMPAGAVPAKAFNEGTTVAFPNIVYKDEHKGFTYVYKVEEVAGTQPGMTYDTSYYTVEVQVTRPADELVVQPVKVLVTKNVYGWVVTNEVTTGETLEDKVRFNNEYTPEPLEVSLEGMKTLTGRDMADGEFEFTVSPHEDTEAKVWARWITLPSNKTVAAPAAADGVSADFRFDAITITRPSTYKLVINEVIPDTPAGGVEYDTHATVATIVVTEVVGEDGRATGQMEASVSYDNGSASPVTSKAVFNNSYSVEDKVYDGFDIEKALIGRDMIDGEFEFLVVGLNVPSIEKLGSENTKVSTVGTSNTSVVPVLENVVFDADDAGMTFSYLVSEVIPETLAGGVTYDQSVFKVSLTVVDNGDGTLRVDKVVQKAVEDENGNPVGEDGVYEFETANAVTFENSYVPISTTAQVSASKVLNGATLSSGQFSFQLKNSAGEVLQTKTNNANGAIVFDPITFTEAGTFAFTVSELDGGASGFVYDPVEHTVVVEVTDRDANGVATGELTASVTYADEGGIVFNNSYAAYGDALVSATKELSGKGDNGLSEHAGDFTFELVPSPQGNLPAIATVTNAADGSIDFGDIEYSIASLDQAVADGYAIPGMKDGKRIWTVNYSVNEKVANGDLPDGISSTTATFEVDVIVTDEGDGVLSTQVIYPEGASSLAFKNTYSVSEPVSVVLSGKKNLTVPSFEGVNAPDITGKFTFTLEAVTSGAPMPANAVAGKAVATNGSTGGVSFGEIVFPANILDGAEWVTEDGVSSRSKTFTYKVTESGSVAGVTNDATSVQKFDITVVDKGIGSLEAYYHTVGYPADGALFSFTNTYSVEPTELAIEASKVMDGRNLNEGEFSFELVDAEGDVLQTVANAADGSVAFDAIEHTQPGVHVYTVREVQGDLGGVTYDVSEYQVTVTVVDNGDGTLSASQAFTKTSLDADGNPVVVDGSNQYESAEAIVFNNRYSTDPVTDSETMVKILTGRDWEEADAFTFRVSKVSLNGSSNDAELEKMPAIEDIVLSGAAGGAGEGVKAGEKLEFVVGPVEFTQPGVYEYAVTELVPDGAVGNRFEGMNYASNTAKIVFTVTDDGRGSLVAEAVVESKEFTNEYKLDPVGDVILLGSKTLVGRDMAEGEEFSFELSAHGDTANAVADGSVKLPAETVVAVSGGADGAAVDFAFDGISFNKAGVYQFAIKEVVPEPGAGGVVYDTHTAIATVEVTKGTGVDAGKLIASEPAYSNGSAPDAVDKAVFTNNYFAAATSGSAELSKTLTGRDWEEDDVFEFQISCVSLNGSTESADLAAMPMPASSVIEVTGKGVKDGEAVAFSTGTFTFTEVGTYVYKVSEVAGSAAGVTYDTTPAVITFVVQDAGKGALSVQSMTVSAGEFTNEYEPASTTARIVGEKVLNGAPLSAGQFSFELKNAEGEVLQTKANLADGTILFDEITYTEVGEYRYIVSEMLPDGVEDGAVNGYDYDGAAFEVVVSVSDRDANGFPTGALSAKVRVIGSNSIQFTNNYASSGSVELSVSKVLENKKISDHEGDFTFELVTNPKLDAGDASAPDVVRTAANDEHGIVDFGTLDYTVESLEQAVADGYASLQMVEGKRVWTVNYSVNEQAMLEDLPLGVTSQRSTYDIDVVVTDNGDGTLSAEVVYPDGGDSIEFTNRYSVKEDVSVTFSGAKVLSLPEWENNVESIEGKYTFELAPLTEGAPMPAGAVDGKAQATNDAAGNVTFGEVVFPATILDDVEWVNEGGAPVRSKEFVYQVTESGSVDGVTNESGVKTFKVIVVDTGTGELDAYFHQVGYDRVGPLFTFTNVYDADPTSQVIEAEKMLDGRELVEGEFSFELCDVATGEVLQTVGNAADGTVVFDAIEYTEPGSYVYLVREVEGALGGVTYDASEFLVTITVEDDGKGHLVAGQEIAVVGEEGEAVDAVVFQNGYLAEPVKVQLEAMKILEGAELDEGQFGFELKDAEGNAVQQVQNASDGVILFEEMVFEEAGVYEYTLVEIDDGQKYVTYDSSALKITIEVTDNLEGAMVANVTLPEGGLTFTNVYEEPLPDTGGKDPGPGGSISRTGDASMGLVGLLAAMVAVSVMVMARARSRMRL